METVWRSTIVFCSTGITLVADFVRIGAIRRRLGVVMFVHLCIILYVPLVLVKIVLYYRLKSPYFDIKI
jgi:hypothetical protein